MISAIDSRLDKFLTKNGDHLLTHRWTRVENVFMDVNSLTITTLALLIVCGLGCETNERLNVTGPPQEGAVTARVLSAFGVDDQEIGINLPRGLQIAVVDGLEQPIADAIVSVYPGGRDRRDMAHQGNGIYEIDVLSDRLEVVEDEYFFEVDSEFIYPEHNVMRVPHEALDQRPTILAPTERSEHPVNENLVVRFEAVPGAEWYDLSIREHILEDWEPLQEDLTDTLAAISAEEAHGFSYIRIRARLALGDEDLETSRYDSRSFAEAQVRIFFVNPEE